MAFDKNKKKQIKDELDELLSSYGSNDDSVVDKNLSMELQKPCPYDFEQIHADFKKEAQKMTSSLLKMYMPAAVLQSNEYLRLKKALDDENLATISFQLKTTRIVIIQLLEQITTGNVNPKLADSVGMLQDKLSSIIKTQANYILFLEETYRQSNMNTSADDLTREGKEPVVPAIDDSDSYYITAGTKSIVRELQSIAVNKHEFDNTLTDPTGKADLMNKLNIKDSDKKNDDNSINDISDLI